MQVRHHRTLVLASQAVLTCVCVSVCVSVCMCVCHAGPSPIMLYTGERVEKRDIAVAIWGGLRGAVRVGGASVPCSLSTCQIITRATQVGLALALIVRQDAHIDHDYGQKLLFHTSGIAFLTLAVNGTSMRLVLGWLGYLKCVSW